VWVFCVAKVSNRQIAPINRHALPNLRVRPRAWQRGPPPGGDSRHGVDGHSDFDDACEHVLDSLGVVLG